MREKRSRLLNEGKIVALLTERRQGKASPLAPPHPDSRHPRPLALNPGPWPLVP